MTQVVSCCKTDPGLVRSENQDTCFASSEQRYFLVADGMGGAAGGALASSIFSDTAKKLFSDFASHSSQKAEQLILETFSTAQLEMTERCKENPKLAGMGCTAELLCLTGKGYVLGHIGDSRTYLLRNNRLQQLTTDHSLIQEQLDSGLITPEQAKTSDLRNVIVRAVGSSQKNNPDIVEGEYSAGDLFLLCSDGLYTMVSDEEIISVLAFDGPLELKLDILVTMAIDAGGKDNIGVTLIEVSDEFKVD